MQPEDINNEENVLQQNYQSVPQYSVPQGEPINYSQQNYIPQPNYYNNNIPQYSASEQNVYQSYENQNQNNQSQNKVNQANNTPNMYESFSFIAWFLFISCKINSFVKKIKTHNTKLYYRPLVYNDLFVEFITTIISSLGFFIYVKNIIYKKHENLYKSLFGNFSKYHSCGLLLYSTLKIIYESFGDYSIIPKISKFSPMSTDDVFNAFDPKAYFTFLLLFSIASLSVMILVYIKTEMKCEWYINMTFKKGIYSLIIFESCFNIFESIFGLRYVDVMDDKDNILDLYKTGGIFFLILIAGTSLAFGLYYKDLIIIFLNFLVNLGIAINFFGPNGPDSKDKEDISGNTDGIFAIIISIFSLALIFALIIKYKEQLMEG